MFQHDIAILRLKRRIALNYGQRVNELPSGTPSGFPFSGTANVSAAGWGHRTRFTGLVGDRNLEDLPSRLQQANTYEYDQSGRMYHSSAVTQYYKLDVLCRQQQDRNLPGV